MVPGAPVATSGILFAVPAFREWLRLSVRTTYHSPIPLSICGAPCRPALCPSRPPTFPPSDSPALRLSRPPTLPPSDSPALRLSCPPPIAPSDLPARLSVCGSGSGFLPALHLRSFSPSCPPPIASSNLPARLTVCRLGPGSLPALHLRGFSPFRPLSVPPSARPVLCQLCPPVFFLPGPPLSLPDSVINLDGHFRGGLPSRTAILHLSKRRFSTHSYIPYIYKERMPFPYTSGNGSVLSVRCSRLPSCLPLRLPSRPPHLPPEFFSSAASFFLPPARPFCTLPHPSSVLFRRLLCLCSHFSRLIVPSRPNFFRLPHPSSALFRRSPLPNSGFSPLAPFPNSIFSPPAAPFFPPFPRKFAAPFGKVKALLRASPSELRIGPTPTSALPRLLLRPQSSRHRFYGRNASCRFTMQSQLRQKNIQKNL